MIRALVAALLLLMATATARADQPSRDQKATKRADPEANTDLAREVDEHLQRGIEFYAQKQYELALVEFRAGYALDPRPDFLFAMAQAERLSGDCPTAVVYYQRFLETHPDPNQAEAARVNLRRCNRALESGPGGRPRVSTPAALEEAEEASAPPEPIQAPAAALTAGPRRDQAPWYHDLAGGAMAGGGVAALGVSIGFWVAKGSAERAASEFDQLLRLRRCQSAGRARPNRVAGRAGRERSAGRRRHLPLSHGQGARRPGPRGDHAGRCIARRGDVLMPRLGRRFRRLTGGTSPATGPGRSGPRRSR